MFQTERISWWRERILLMHICPSSKRTTVLHCKYGQLTESYRQALKRSPTHLLLSQFCLQWAANQESIHICLLLEAFRTTPPLRNTYPKSLRKQSSVGFRDPAGPRGSGTACWMEGGWRRSFPSSRIFKFLGLFRVFLQHFSL